MAVIEVKNVNVTYRVLMNKSGSLKELFRDALKGKARVVDYVALQDISFTVDKGEVVAILGRNGAGKSTLLKVLAGVLPPTRGSVMVDGKIAKEGKLTIKVLAGKELAQFGGLRAVGNSSPKPGPRFIEISYTPKLNGKKTPHVVLVGKGITFDTGGVSLKRPYDLMMAMKSDMAGASAVLNVVGAMPDLKPRVKVTALLMCAENALSGTSQRPSDVITHYGGTTVEVLDTDAEGRLVLADGLAYADAKLDPDYLLDIATLTGSATLGLGRQYGAMYTRDSKLAAQLFAAGESSGDRLWPMPLIDEYQDSLDSDIADFNHTADKGGYSAGSVTAALFLEKFTGQRKWVHLDVAGTARSENDAGESPKGGTGFGVRVLIDWIMSL